MRQPSAIWVDQAIVHILGSQAGGGLTLSDRSLPLLDNPEASPFFAGHIKRSLNDAVARAGRFVALEDGSTASVCRALLAGSLDLLPASRQLAERLYSIIAGDGRISDGALAVCLYRDQEATNSSRYLALLKIDKTQFFNPRVTTDAAGVEYVTIDRQADGLPGSDERLQKCAFVRVPPDPNDYDMLILDRQAGGSSPLSVARFFLGSFLGADLAFDNRALTKKLHDTLLGAQSQVRSDLTAEQNRSLQQAITVEVTGASTDVDGFLERLPIPEEPKRQLATIIKAELPDRQFALDPTYGQRLMRRSRFKGSHGLTVEVRADHEHDVIQSQDFITPADGPGYWRIVIRTEDWKAT
ncbi:MAG: nucleoid-associated protein [Chloroflexi bacterium]|nr:nucleoid-associated protein [Chloroflexota bacterium]